MSEATIYEQGYRTYDGPRNGVGGAVRSLVTHSIRAVLGLGRSARHKIIPVVVIVMAFLPAVAFVGLAVLLPDDLQDGFLPDYPEYFGFISMAILLFTAFVGPELLCSDRRTGMLGVYLASPLTRGTYLLGKVAAIGSILTIVTLGPTLLLLIALSLTGSGPDSFGEWMTTLLQIIGSGLAISAIFTAVAMAVSATTDRTGAAIAATMGVLFGSSIVANTLVEAGDLSRRILMGDLIGLPIELNFRIHGEEGELATREVSTGLMTLVALGIVAACAVWVWDRYRRMLVRR
jgi:ABC-2 type transport system permease protein